MADRRQYKMAGHKCILVPCGEKKNKQSAFSSGWSIKCSCGWSYGCNARIRRDAEEIYANHIKLSLPMCHCCGEIKAEREMSKCNRLLCKKCVTKKSKDWGAQHKSVWERQKRKSHLKKKYNLSIEDYDQMIIDQGGVCAICGGSLYDSRGYRPHVDHDHATDTIRGILCTYCNNALGKWKDDKSKLMAAYNYLLKYEKKMKYISVKQPLGIL